jgi:hypothetical protein
MGVTRSLVKLSVGGAIVLGGLAFPPLLLGDKIVWGTLLATALISVAAGNTANAIDALIDGKDSERVSLENADLTRAVGKAIAAVITLAAKQHRGKTHDNLEKIAIQAKNNWVKIAQQELTQQRYPQLREAKLDQFLTPEEYSLTQNGNLTPQDWQDIFIRLNMAACKGGGFQLPSEVYPQVAELLYTTFPKALRETLKEDFAKDGKAFAGFTLQLLTGMKAELAQLQNTNLGVNAAELSQILQQFQQLETQLRGTVAQQQAFFSQISQDIDSGFAEVCQQLGVMETNITGLLQNLEKRLDALDEKLARLEAQGGKRQLSKQEYRSRQALFSQMGVESRLEQSLHHAVLLNLGKEQQPHQVQRPWDVSVKVGEQRAFQLPAQTSILEVFDNPAISGKFLIVGKPGSGKTTTLLELAQALIARAETDSDAPIPVILELSAWRTITKRKFPDFWNKEKYDPSIKEWILSQLRSKGVSQEIGEQWIREKELVLLLDGLDELPSERQAKCVQAINQFLDSEFSPLYLVVCSRKEEYEEYKEVLHLNGAICLEDLRVEQIQHYFASVNLGDFWESIKDSEKIVNFISQPLFLAITSIAYQQIDIEEWRNCNSEKNSIDYLLGVYRVRMLTEKNKTNQHKLEKIEFFKIQRSLILIAHYIAKRKEFVVENIVPDDFFYLNVTKINTKLFISLFIGMFYIPSLPLLIYFLPTLFSGKFNFTFLLYSLLYVVIFYPLFPFYSLIYERLKKFGLYNLGIQYYKFWLIFLLIFIFLLKSSDFFMASTTISIIIIFIFPVFWFQGILDQVFEYLSEIKKDLLSMILNTGFNWVYFLSLKFLLKWIYPNIDNKDMLKLIGLNINNLTIDIVTLILALYFGIVWGGGAKLIKYFVFRLILGFIGEMPWNITRFLDYCTERLILQRVGNRYRFIHRLVQEHFANLEIQKE